MKTYPLEIYPLWEHHGRRFGWASKGHHAPVDFLHALLEDQGDAAALNIDDPSQETWRFIPSPDPDNPGYCVPAKPGTRGAFPITVVYDQT